MKPQTYFSEELFKFLRELNENNNREWFAANKARYEQVARNPMLLFIEDLQPVFAKVASNVIAVPSTMGGSMFRINRDTRFSKDKSPYKTSVAAQFRLKGFGTDISAPGFYIHIEPERIFMGGGIYHPDGKQLYQIRTAIAEHPESWKQAVSDKEFVHRCNFWGDSLKRPPLGFNAQHPLIEDLKRKDFAVMIELNRDVLCSARLMQQFEENCRLITPMAKFLSAAVGAKW